jgi:hypothetical protein
VWLSRVVTFLLLVGEHLDEVGRVAGERRATHA